MIPILKTIVLYIHTVASACHECKTKPMLDWIKAMMTVAFTFFQREVPTSYLSTCWKYGTHLGFLPKRKGRIKYVCSNYFGCFYFYNFYAILQCSFFFFSKFMATT